MEHATQVSVSAHGSSNGSSSGLSSGGTSSRTSSSTNLGSAAAFTNGDDFGTFATPALSPPAAPVTSDSYAEMFGALSSSSSSLEPPPPLSAFSQSALSEISFADDEYDSPFADIVNEPPKSANASRNNSFSHSGMAFEPLQQQPAQASAGGIEMGSPLLSFSPVATPSTLSMAPSASSLPDIFSSPACVASVRVDMFSLSTKSVSSAPAEAELLSFSPLALSSSAGSQKKPTPRFSLPPPRAVTMPSQSPGAVSSTKAASFSGQVSVGELLSFSPVASAPLSSFSGSLGGSSAAAAASIFDDDELFSLSTGGLAIDFSTSAADPYPVAASPSSEISPVSFGDSMIQDFTVNQSSASMEIKSPAEEVGSSTLVAESEVQVVDAKEEECAFPGQQEDDGEALEQQSPVSGELHILSEERVHAELKELQHSGSDDDSSAGDEESRGSIAGVATETVEATQDAQRLSIPSPVGYSQFEFITQDFSPQASQSDEQAGSSFDEENGDKALERELSAENSPPSDTDQYQPFSQDSDGDQYTSLGDLSEEGFGGSAASPAHSQEFKRLHELRSTSGAPEPAHKPIGHEDSSEALEYASFSSSGSGERGFQADVETSAGVQQSGVDRESALSTSPTAGGAGEFQATDVQGFGALSASKSSAESTTNGEYGDEDTNDARDDGFSDFGAPPNAELAVQTGFSGFQTCANVASATDGGDDEFGGFSASPTSQPDAKSFQATSATSFPANVDTRDDFGGFSSGSFGGDDAAADDFGDFAQSSNPVDGGADDDAFGDFGQSSSAVGDDDDDAFAGFGQSSSSGFEANAPFSLTDDDFGDFNGPAVSAAPSAFVAVTTSSSITTLLSSKHELVHFFSQAFPVYSTPTPLDTGLHVPAVASHTSKELFQDKGRSNELVATIYRAAVESYFQDSSSAMGSTVMGTELFSSKLKDFRLKHLKYVLTEKIQEASRHDGIFPHGSDRHHVLLSLVNSDDERKMRDALTSVQDSLFSSSVNDAMMRIARQAALSAKAKIAEQAAHQQASTRGSLLATTRQLLSRSGGGGTAGTAGGSRDATGSSAASLGVLTPTGASVHKISRFSFAGGGHDNEAATAAAVALGSTAGTGSGGEDSGGENDCSGRNSYEADSAPHTPVSGRHSGSGSGSSTGGGGLIRKFQDRFSSFSTSRNRPRLVSLRRMGQSGEDVRTMELHMDSISGGLDQVKWKCAVFLYDVDEVAQVAPSQIRILSYPGKEVLAGKSDRTALLKFLKPGAIWTIDIGASNNDVLNEW